jgi:transcriptional regulator with XRE-family HTH domain
MAKRKKPISYHRLRAWRVHLGLKPIEAAKLVGVPKPTLSRWETGVIDLKLSNLDLISRAYNVSRADLIDRDPPKK